MDGIERDPLLFPEQAGKLAELLLKEATLLSRLYAEYLADRDFLAAPSTRVLYFLDAHDIKAFVDPAAADSLYGFENGAERLHRSDPSDSGLTRPTLTALRHDQIMTGLLFDPSSVAGLLPSHAAEMDQEIAFRLRRFMDSELGTVKEARREIERLADTARRLANAAKQLATPETSRELVRFFQANAPALTAILRDDLDSPRKRLQMVLEHSRLTLLDCLDWKDLGMDGHGRPVLGTIAASEEVIGRLRRRLSERRNTALANAVDAGALAHVVALQAALNQHGASHVRVLLVSRAATLLRAAINMADSDGVPLAVRHPRLLALDSADLTALDAAAAALGMALEVYRTHLADLAMPGRANISALAEVTAAFLPAWDAFESSRLAMEARWQGKAGGEAADEQALVQQLVNLFCSEKRAGAILSEMLLESMAAFGKAASAFLMSPADLQIPVWVVPMPNGRLQLSPLARGRAGVISPVGPVEIGTSAWSPGKSMIQCLDKIAEFVTSIPDRYLIWSVALASSGRWQQASIFAHGAAQMAGLSIADARARDDALLLCAELRRLGADGSETASGRFHRAMAELKLVSEANALRRIREETAQTLEAFLAGHNPYALGAASPEADAERLDRAIDALPADASSVRFIAMLLTLHLVAERRPAFWPGRTVAARGRAQLRHLELVARLDALTTAEETDALPRRARAMVVIGFVLFGNKADGQQPPVPGPLSIPEEWRADTADLIEGLKSSRDAIGLLLCAELEDIEEVLRASRTPNLLLEPVRLKRVVDLLSAPGASILRQAREAYDSTGDVTMAFHNGGLAGAHKAPIEAAIYSLEAVVASPDMHGLSVELQFNLRMELQFMALLRAHLLPRHSRREAIRALAVGYEAIARDHPTAALPHVRLDHIATECGDLAMSVKALRQALERVDTDPFLLTEPRASPHWMQSFVRRRLTVQLMPSGAEARHQPGKQSPDAVAAQVAALVNSCRRLLDADARDTAEIRNAAHRLEERRRSNNIVYNLARLLERDGGREAMLALKIDTPAEVLINKLLQSDLHPTERPTYLHTAGCYFAASGRSASAVRVGKELLELMLQSKQEMHGEDTKACLEEAVSWCMRTA